MREYLELRIPEQVAKRVLLPEEGKLVGKIVVSYPYCSIQRVSKSSVSPLITREPEGRNILTSSGTYVGSTTSKNSIRQTFWCSRWSAHSSPQVQSAALSTTRLGNVRSARLVGSCCLRSA